LGLCDEPESKREKGGGGQKREEVLSFCSEEGGIKLLDVVIVVYTRALPVRQPDRLEKLLVQGVGKEKWLQGKRNLQCATWGEFKNKRE